MKNRLIFLPAFIALVSVSCKKKVKPPSPSGALQFNQTQCTDPWHPEVRNFQPDYAEKLEAWLEAETGKSIAKLEVKNVGGDKFVACDACPCTTGYAIYIWPANGDAQKFIDLGFFKP